VEDYDADINLPELQDLWNDPASAKNNIRNRNENLIRIKLGVEANLVEALV
jgi:hypothetical protein